jgi:hypothetical protein
MSKDDSIPFTTSSFKVKTTERYYCTFTDKYYARTADGIVEISQGKWEEGVQPSDAQRKINGMASS